MLDKAKEVGNKVLNKKISLKEVLIWSGVAVVGGAVVYTVAANYEAALDSEFVVGVVEGVGDMADNFAETVNEVTEEEV